MIRSLVGALSLVACGESPSLIHFTVCGEVDAPTEVDSLVLTVSGPVASGGAEQRRLPLAGPLPARWILEAGEVLDDEVILTVDALLGEERRMRRAVRTRFVPAQTVEAEMVLPRGCLEIECDWGTSCSFEQQCEPPGDGSLRCCATESCDS